MNNNGKATKVDIVKRFNKSIAESAQEVSSRNSDGVANILNYILDEDEYGGDGDEINFECEAIRRYVKNINPKTKFAVKPKYVLSEDRILALTGRCGLKKQKLEK